MMDPKKKISAFLLALLLMLPVLAACGDTADAPKSGDAVVTENAVEADAEETTEEVVTRAPLAVPTGDYDGYNFTVLSYQKGDVGSHLEFLDFDWSTDRAGESINDAVYTRNLAVEEAFNVSISTEQVADAKVTARKVISSGADEYDVVQPYIDGCFTMAQEGMLIDLYTMPGIDITNEWWDSAILRDLTLCGKLYVVTGDISMADEQLNYGVFFNKSLVGQYNLDDYYQAVRDNKWTLDTMIAAAETVTHDLNGDGVLGEDDVYGILTDYGIAPIWYFSMGGQIAAVDANGEPKLVLNSERTVQVMESLKAMMNNKQAVLNAADTKGSWTGFDEMLMDNRALFRIGSIYDITYYRTMVDDFGILPYPKYDEKQDSFYHIIATQVAMGIAVPVTASDPERTGVLLEALAYGSKDTVTKAYYDINLYTKVARDEESGESLDIIFATKRYDLAKVCGWGGLEDVLRGSVRSTGSFASLYAAAESKAQAALEKTYEYFLEQ